MSADLHIHAMTPDVTEADLAAFSANTLGSKHFRPFAARYDFATHIALFTKISNTPNVWIGEVSWLKAAVMNDPDAFIPSAVQRVHDLIGEDLPVLDNALAANLLAAIPALNTTGYRVVDVETLRDWLAQHLGLRLFQVSW